MSSAELDPAEQLADRVGLDRAYADPNKVYMTGDSMYVAGTISFGDVLDDLGLPFGLTRGTQRYIDAERVLQSNPKIREWWVTRWEELYRWSCKGPAQSSRLELMGPRLSS